MKEQGPTEKARALIAEHLGVEIENLTDDLDFTKHLGIDSIDLLELAILMEEQFTGIEITDDAVNRIASVGDLIRHIETTQIERALDAR